MSAEGHPVMPGIVRGINLVRFCIFGGWRVEGEGGERRVGAEGGDCT